MSRWRNPTKPEPTYPITAVAEDLAQFFESSDESVVYEVRRCPEFDNNRRVCAALDAVTDAELALEEARANALQVAAAEARDLVAAWIAYSHVHRALRTVSKLFVFAGVHTDEEACLLEQVDDQPADAWRAFIASGLAWEYRKC